MSKITEIYLIFHSPNVDFRKKFSIFFYEYLRTLNWDFSKSFHTNHSTRFDCTDVCFTTDTERLVVVRFFPCTIFKQHFILDVNTPTEHGEFWNLNFPSVVVFQFIVHCIELRIVLVLNFEWKCPLFDWNWIAYYIGA